MEPQAITCIDKGDRKMGASIGMGNLNLLYLSEQLSLAVALVCMIRVEMSTIFRCIERKLLPVVLCSLLVRASFT